MFVSVMFYTIISSLVGMVLVVGFMGRELFVFILMLVFGVWILMGLGVGCTGLMEVDGLSYLLVALSIWLVGLVLLVGSGGCYYYSMLCLLMLLFLLLSFLSVNLLFFYVSFEMVLVFMFIMILGYGYQPERLESGVYMIIYAVVGALPFLCCLLGLYTMMGTLSFSSMGLCSISWNGSEVLVLLVFLVKLPMYGLHLWLPKAHVEAPVGGSSLLAGLLLKLGCYGILRILGFSYISSLMLVWLMVMGLFGGIFGSLLCSIQLDMKKLIAYSSVVHMGMFLGGVMTLGHYGLVGGMMSMISHGLGSSGLFYLANLLYLRLGSRNLLMIKGLISLEPKLVLWGFLLMAGSMAAPPFLSMFGEIYLGSALICYFPWFMVLLFLVYFFPVFYMMYFFSLISHGKVVSYLVFKGVQVVEYLVLALHFTPLLLLVLKMEVFVLMY